MSAARTRKSAHPAASIRTGIGGWTYAPWRDNFYPADLVQRRELEYASRALTAIEINGTFYGAQKPATYAKWRDETPDGFVFSLKAPRYVVGRTRLADAGDAIDGFIDGGLAEFGDRLGPINWQLPEFKAFDAEDIAAFFARLPRKLGRRALRHVVEVRHASFANAEFVELARTHGIAIVFTDSPDYPSIADATADFVYLRLRCCDASIATGYTAKALGAWAERARAWAAGGTPDDLPLIAAPAAVRARDVFVYFINGAKERAPHAAMALIERLAAD